jgi:Protein of unknown function (DUF2950)
MFQGQKGASRFQMQSSISSVAFVIFALSLFGSSRPALSQEPGQKTYSSPQEASAALHEAIRSGDQQSLRQVLGPTANEMISSGDKDEDRRSQQQFVEKYQQMHRLGKERDGRITLYVGAENWPMPVPLVSNRNRWYFDCENGKREILLRRVGRNEMQAMEVCRALVEAQREYSAEPRDGDSVKQYAARFVSDEGKQNGLYWKSDGGKPESPIGPLVTFASTEDYRKASIPQPKAFYGYYFRLLNRQGKNAPGGARSYFVNGKMTRGFAFVAYPAEYGSSGVMTFIINQDGIMYQKDLGSNTTNRARTLSSYNPDTTWKRVQ